MEPNHGTGPLPFLIGVSGHTDLRETDYPELESKLDKIFQNIKTKYPSTPLVLLSPLAEGADRLTARVALKHGSRLIVVLPMRRDLYEKDFASPESRGEFDELWKTAENVIEVPLIGGNTEASIQDYGPGRDLQYAGAGAFIARHSQLMIALWDGVDTGLVGGTWQVVRFNLEGVPEPFAPVRNLLDPVECGPVFQIVTPRKKNPNPERSFQLIEQYPPGYPERKAAQNAYNRIWNREETFNKDALRLKSRLRNEIEKSKDHLLPESRIEEYPFRLRSIRELFGISDALAIHYRKRTLLVSRLFFSLVFLAVFFYQIYPTILPDAPRDTELYLASLVLILVLYLYSKKADYENKYLDYRALTEGLRVQFFWRLAGVPESAADHYLHKQRSELDWIRDAIRALSLLSNDSLAINPAKDVMEHRFHTILTHWVQDQSRYYSKSTWRDRSKLRRLKFLSQGLLWIGAALAFLKVIVDPLFRVFAGAMALAPALGAIFNAYTEQRGFSQHAKQYGRMSGLFGIAEDRLQKLISAGNHSSAMVLIEELGKEALAENGDWVILHRERPIEILKAS
jgi:hypothetical protein